MTFYCLSQLGRVSINVAGSEACFFQSQLFTGDLLRCEQSRARIFEGTFPEGIYQLNQHSNFGYALNPYTVSVPNTDEWGKLPAEEYPAVKGVSPHTRL